jgi:cytochrome c nitrite reductase small subunit
MVKYFRKFIGWILAVFKKRALTFFMGFIFALLCFVAINAAMKPVSKSKFCGNNCHEMHSALNTWQLSVHGGNQKGLSTECVDCHLPEKDDYFTHLITKAYMGAKHLSRHYAPSLFSSEEASQKPGVKVLDRTDRMKNEICVRCHAGLLSKPSNETIREAHMMALNSSDNSEQTKCVECHEDVGHKQ